MAAGEATEHCLQACVATVVLPDMISLFAGDAETDEEADV